MLLEVLFESDCQLLQEPVLHLPAAHLYIVIEHQVPAQDVVVTVLLLTPLHLSPQRSLIGNKPFQLLLGPVETPIISATAALLVEAIGVLPEAHEHPDLERMDLEIGVEVEEALVVHVNLIESPHIIISFIFEMLPEKPQPHRLYDRLLQEEDDPTHEEATPSLVKLEIELENGNKVYISPQPSDEPVRLATEFCEEHNLDTEMIDILAESIKKSITHTHSSCSRDCPPPARQHPTHSPHYFSKRPSVNSSLPLYEKGLMLEDAKRHWIARENERRRVEEMRECTHKPKINHLSRSLITQREAELQRMHMEDESPFNRGEGKRLSSQLSIRSSILIESKQSRPPQQERKHSTKSTITVFEKLYQNRRPDEISRSKILTEVLREETHHPIINDISKEIVGGATFSQRLVRYERERQDKHTRLRRTEQAEKENLHKPKTGPPPQNRNTENLPIGDFLYNKKKKPPVPKKESQQPHINRASKLIYEKRKNAAYLRIFQHLSAKTGKVDWRALDPNTIDPQLLAVLQPLVEEIEILQIELSLEDFKAALDFLFGTLSPTDKGLLLNFGLPSGQALAPAKRQAVMNKNSEAIAQSMGRSRISIYDYCSIRETMRLQRMEQERVEKQRREMQECTFEPRIDRRGIYY